MNDPEVKQPWKTGTASEASDTAAMHIDDFAAPSKQLEVLFQRTQGLAAMQASLNQMIVEFKRNPTETSQLDAAAYIEALEKAPHLIVSESDPTLFLRRENGDAAAAAGRLLKYWAYRRQSFGPDRAFRSLLNGDALDSQAIQCVRSGALAVLPPDTSGRSVLCVDLDRRMAGEGQESVLTSQLNAALFTLSLTFSNLKSQSEGVVILWTLSSKGSLNVPHGEKVFSLIAEALPLKVHSRYIACLAPRGARSLILNQFVPGADRSCGALSFPGVIPHSIGLVGYTPAELCGQMEQNYFRKEHIPASVGGTWDYQRNTDFLKAQMTSCLEGEQSQSSLAKETSPAPSDDHAQIIELHEPARGSLKGSSAVSRSEGQLGALFRSTQGLAAMQVALNQMIEMFRQNPDTAKPDASAYIEAMERSPHLIVSESDPTLFLRREDGDTEAAARRLLNYWAFRREHFGPDFAYQSVLSGDALDPNAIRNTRSGALAVLPPDSRGRSVLCFDSTRRIAVVGHEHRALTSRLMSVHYILSSMSSNPKSQSEGIVMLWVMSQKGSLDMQNAEKFYSLIAEALPIKVHSRYIACCVPRNAKRLFLDQFIPGADRHTGAWLYPGIIPRATSLVGYSPADLCAQLEQVGFEKQNIPASVGGVWDFQNNIAAIDARLASRSLHEQRAHDDDGDKKLAAIASPSVSSNNSMLQLGKPSFAGPGPCLNATMTSSAKTHAEAGAGSMEDTLCGKDSSLAVAYSLLSKSDNLPVSSGPSELNTTSFETAKNSDAQLQAAARLKGRLGGTFSGMHESVASGSTLFPIGSPYSTNYSASVPNSDEISRLFQSDPVLSTMEIALNEMIGEFKQKPVTALPDASAFLEAVERSPHLIAQESHPVTFLRREDGDSVAASRRLLKYWTSRRAILGPNLAYRRLLNGDALDSETTRRLKLGAFANLPPDRDGRSVICIDLERRWFGSPDAEKQYRSKALYYVVSQTFANPKSQSDGVVLLRILSQNGSLDVSNTKKLFDLVAEALPVKLHSLHVACCAPPGAKHFFLDQFISAMHRMPGTESLPDTITHVGDSPPDLCRQLATYGFQKECLPALTGGTWDYQRFVDFVDEQMLSRTIRLKHMDGTTHSKFKELKNEYGKRKNSNRESGKRKGKIARIQSAPYELPMVDQNQVRFSEDSLQKLDAAMETIPAECFDQGATEAEKAAYIRKRNAIYSKRKYYKTKLQIESLECSKRSLLAEKEVLKEENLWLEYLIEKAQRSVLAHEEGEQQPFTSSVEGSGRDEVTGQVLNSDCLCEHGTANLPSERKRDLTTLSKPPPGVSMSSTRFVHSSPDVSRKLVATMASIPVDGFDPIGSSEEKAEYDRKRNAVYSKRYYKWKVKVDSLKSSRESLVVENKMLKEENQRLENLYQMAQREALVHEARVQQFPISAVAGSRLAHSFTSGGAIDPLALAPMPPNQEHVPLVVDSVGMRRLQLAALIAGEEARRLSVHLDSTSLHPSHEGEGMVVDSSRRVSASLSPSSYPNLSHYPQSASETGLLGATWLPSDRGDFLSGSRVPDVLGLMPTGSEHSVDRMEHRVGQNIFLAAQPMAHQQLGDVSYFTELQQLGVLDNLGRAQPPRAGLEQVRHLLNEVRIRQDLASQLALELRSAIPAQAAPSWTVQRTALDSLLLSPLELEQLRQLDRTRNSVLLPLLGAQASSQPVSFQRTSQDDLLSELLAIQRLREHNMRR